MDPALDLTRSPFQRLLGLQLERAGDGEVELRLPFREEFLQEEGSDWLHGGVVAAVLDVAGDYAIVTKTGVGVPTIDLRVDWLRPARRGELRVIGRVVKLGRTVSVADAEVRDERGELVAVGRAAYASPKA